VAGDWAHCWTELSVVMTPTDGGPPIRHSGHTLSIFRRRPVGRWVLARDANLLAVEKDAPAN
jgi:ketosteroid isomerase-like protein